MFNRGSLTRNESAVSSACLINRGPSQDLQRFIDGWGRGRAAGVVLARQMDARSTLVLGRIQSPLSSSFLLFDGSPSVATVRSAQVERC